MALGEQIDRHLLIRFKINITASQITGIMIDQPRIPDPLDSLVEGFSSCTIYPPAEDQVISMDVFSMSLTNFLVFQAVLGLQLIHQLLLKWLGQRLRKWSLIASQLMQL